MDKLNGFEEIIDLDKFFSSMENLNENLPSKAEETLSEVLDEMCDSIDEASIDFNDDKITIAFNTGEKPDSTKVVEDVVNLDDFELILKEVCDSKDKIDSVERIDVLLDKNCCEIALNQSFDGNFIAVVDTEYNAVNDIKHDEHFKQELSSTSTLKTICEEKQDWIDVEINLNVTYVSKIDGEIITFNADNDLKGIEIEELNTNAESITSNDVHLIVSDDDGYDSSDFEFISETEAKKEGLSIKSKVKLDSANSTNANKTNEPNAKKVDPDDDFIKYHKNRYVRCIKTLQPDRDRHVIPEGERYLDLFRGMYAPAVMNNLRYATNKRVLPVKYMTTDSTDGFGFELPLEAFEEDSEYADEAKETVKKINFLYPYENRKRRRRH